MKSYAPPKLRQVVTEAIFRRRRIVMLTMVVVLVLVALLTALMHRKYTAQAKLMVQNVRSNAPLNTSPTDRLVSQQDVSPTEVNSEVDLLQSAAVARRALEGGGGAENALSRPATAAEATAVASLQHNLTVEPVHQTSLINVSLLANSPQAAERQLNAVLNAYFEQRAGTGRATGAADFFARQVQVKGDQLTLDTKALADFDTAHDIGDLDDQKRLQVTRIASLEDQLNASETQLARDRSATAAERRQLIVTPSRATAAERTITNQYSQEHLDSELIDLENRRDELMKRYVPTDRQIVAVNDQIAALRRGITASQSHPATESATEINPVWQSLTASVATSSSDASGLSAQRAELARQKSAAVARLAELQAATVNYDELRRKMAQAQSDYQLYVQKRDESRVAEALDREKMFDVSLVQPPMASYEPVRPKPALYMFAGLVFALLLGVALALYVDTAADQVYTPSQLDALTGTRTLATLADEGTVDGAGTRNATELRRVLVAIAQMHGGQTSGAEMHGRQVYGAGTQEGPLPDGKASRAAVVAFTSAIRGEGVGYIVHGLAREAARQVGVRVACINAAELASRFERTGQIGFGLRRDEAKGYWVLGDEPAIDVAPAGAAAPEPTLAGGFPAGRFGQRLQPLIEAARAQFDYIFVECPSLAQSTLAIELDSSVDGYVAVVGAAQGRKSNVEQMGDTLRETQAPVLGYVLNRRRYDVPAWLHRLVWSRA